MQFGINVFIRILVCGSRFGLLAAGKIFWGVGKKGGGTRRKITVLTPIAFAANFFNPAASNFYKILRESEV